MTSITVNNSTDILNTVKNDITSLRGNLPFNISPDVIFMVMIATIFFFVVAVIYGYGTWFIILFIAAAIIFIIVNILITMGNQGNFQFGPFTLFAIVIAICVYVFLGLYITEGIETTSMLMLIWGVYTLMAFTLLNVILVVLFWSVVRKKTGLPGVRGIIGERGKQGPRGQCDVNSVQNYTIMTLTNYIDNLYSQQPGNSNATIIDSTSKLLINNYLNTKISAMASSHQMNMLVNVSMTNRVPIVQLVNYLTQIWTIWFNLIYAAGGNAWFNDIHGDENSTWSNTTPLNPFIEIRKYDIYNWGLTRSFKPLKIEICQSTSDHENPDLPKKRQPILKVIASNDYTNIGDDKGSGGNSAISWWRAKKVQIGTDSYHPVGDIPMSGTGNNVYDNVYKTGKTVVGTMEYDVKEGGASGLSTVNGPDVQTILVSGDVKAPVSYQNTWHGSGDFKPGLSRPVCPTGYVSLGDVASISNNTDMNNPPICIPEKCVEPIGQDGNTIWTNGTGLVRNINGWVSSAPSDNTPRDNYAYNLMRTDNSNTSVFYKIRPACLNVGNDAPSTKDLEPNTAKLGVGWYGSPAKVDPKYSVFSFLGMVPEGLIIHQGTTRRFYIIHYGGDDLNKFIVLDYNGGSGKFDGALQVDSDVNSIMISLKDISRDDARQQWVVDFTSNYAGTSGSKKVFVLVNVHNGRILYVDLDPKLGEAIFSTMDISNPGASYTKLSSKVLEGVTFSFVSTVGVNMDVLGDSSQ